MTHSVDGFGLEFTARKSWKAQRYEFGSKIDVIPVTWTKGLQFKTKMLEVWFCNPVEMETHRKSREPFVVALAIAKDYSVHPHEFQEFRAVYEVVATGNMGASEGGTSIETSIVRRIYGKRTGLS